MSQQFQLQPPPDDLRTPLVKLKDHYVQQIEEYLTMLALAKDKLAHVEALLEAWSSVEELPHQNQLTPIPTASSRAIPENVESEVGDVRDFESSLINGNGNASGAVKENAVPPHPENGASSHTSIEEPFSPTLLERFIDTLDTSTRTLLSFCVDSRGIEITDTASGGKTLSLECPNDAVFRRLKSKLPRLVFKWNQAVSSNSIVVISMAKNPFDHKGLSWSKEDLAQLSSKVDKVVEVNGVAYTQLTNNDRSWLAIVPQSVLTPKESDEKQFLMPPQPPTTTNTLVNGERNGSTSSDGVQHVEMLPPYQGMERMEALSLLLTEHSGTVLHLGFIVRSLYGELEPSLFKVIKTRVASSLTKGVEQGLWARVTDEPGCYTLDLKLMEPLEPPPAIRSGSGGLSQRKRKSSRVNLSSLMLPAYRGQSVKAAVASIIESHPGKIYSIDDFIAFLFGSVEPKQKSRVRAAVSRGLFEGKQEGRFERVLGSSGCYTLSMSLLGAQSIQGTPPLDELTSAF